MGDIHRVGDLQIGEDLDFQRLSWTVERIGWVVGTLLLLAAVVGLFGSGPLSTATARTGTRLMVEYARFERYKSPTQLQVRVGPGAAQQGKVRIWLDRRYLEENQLQQVVPQPSSVEIGSDRLTYAFEVSQPDEPISVTFFIEPQHIGPNEGRVGLDDGQPVSFSQLIYP